MLMHAPQLQPSPNTLFSFPWEATKSILSFIPLLLIINALSSGIPVILGQFQFDMPYPPPADMIYKWQPNIDNLTSTPDMNNLDPMTLSWQSELGDRYRQEAVEQVASICGRGHVCDASGLDPGEFPDKKDCTHCDNCRCDDVCVTYGDCCLDKVFDDVIRDVDIRDTPSLLEESSQSSCFDMRARDHWSGDQIKKQRLVSACPPSYTQNDDVIRQCNKGRETFYEAGSKILMEDLWNIWPVTSNKSSVSYRNRACAECHHDDLVEGEEDNEIDDNSNLVHWNLKVSCANDAMMPPSMTRAQILQFVLDRPECLLVFHVPPGVEVRECSHLRDETHDPAVTMCNATSRRQSFDPVLWKMCSTFPTTTMKSGYGDVLYANVFCVLCQEEFVIRWKAQCPFGTPFNFFFMISPGAIRRVVARGREVPECGCSGDQVKDPITNTCRNLLCPQGHDLSRDREGHFRCVDDSTISKGLSYSLNIELALVNSTLTYDDLRKHDAFLDVSRAIQTTFFSKLKPGVSKFFSRVNQFVTFLHPPKCQSTQNTSTSTLTIGLSAKIHIMEELNLSRTAPKLISLLKTSWNVFVAPESDRTLTLTLEPKLATPPDPFFLDFVMTTPNSVTEVLHIGCDDVYIAVDIADTYRIVVENYTEVKNTLTCPYFILNLNEDFVDYFVQERHPDLNGLLSDGISLVLVYNKSNMAMDEIRRDGLLNSDGLNISISMADVHVAVGTGQTTGTVTVVCADQILRYWEEVKDKMATYDDVIEGGRGEHNFGKGLEWTSVVCLSISCLCLLLTLVTYLLFPSLRTLPGKNTMALVTTLLISMCLCLVTPLFHSGTATCQVVGVANHFFLLSSVMWMTICTYRMYRIFTRIFDHPHGQGSDTTKTSRCFIKYFIVSIFVPTLIITTTIIINYYLNSNSNVDNTATANENKNKTTQNDNNIIPQITSPLSITTNRSVSGDIHTRLPPIPVTVTSTSASTSTIQSTQSPASDSSYSQSYTSKSKLCHQNEHTSSSNLTPIGYGDGVCYLSNQLSVLLAAALPILVAVLTNCVLFCLTLRSMRQMTSDQKTVRKEPRQQIVIYVKLCALTGLNWLPGLLSIFIDSEILWFTFLVLAGLQLSLLTFNIMGTVLRLVGPGVSSAYSDWGFYVLVAFVLNARVMNLYKARFCSKGHRSDAKVKVHTKDTSLTNTNSHSLQDDHHGHHTKNDDVGAHIT